MANKRSGSKRRSRSLDRRKLRHALNHNISFFKQVGRWAMRVRYGDGINSSDLRGDRCNG
jgi:hypothetical protein